jgi:hypothetical protein
VQADALDRLGLTARETEVGDAVARALRESV